MKFAVIFSVLSLVSVSAFADPKSWHFQQLQKERARSSMQFAGFSLPASDSSSGTLDQIVDHFAANPAASGTFKQRYFIDASYAQGKDSPVILYICGEGKCEGASGTPEVDQLASDLHAYRVAIEHRYYGTSQPFPTLESKNLKFLSMGQAIEDLAYFQKSVQSKLQLTGKWISMGGSYAGELSAFYRLKHPELVVGALASSGPVLAKADFFEYDRHVAKVAGPECLAAIKIAVSDVEARLKNPASATQVKKLFKADKVKDDVDFLYVIADMGAIAIQYGYQAQFCKAITGITDPAKVTAAYAAVGTRLMDAFQLTPFTDSFQSALNTDPNYYLEYAGSRAWMYQSCTEFGFYQMANPNVAESARSQQITLGFHDDVCKKLFGLTKPVDTAATNATYYNQLLSPRTRNIFLTNGSNDPWSNLSILAGTPAASANPNLNLFTILGAAHCGDLGSAISDALVSARSQFTVLAKQWISE